MRSRFISVRRLAAEAIPRGRYATHGVDSYPAKMVPHLARYAIQAVSRVGDTVYDPFCGCGTVMVESMILGRNSSGSDINPVAVLLARAKSATVDPCELTCLAEEVVVNAREGRGRGVQYPAWLSYWFTERTLEKLGALLSAIPTVRARGKYAVALRAALALTVRRVSRADPRSPKPFVSQRARKTRLGKHFDPLAVYAEVAAKLSAGYEDLMSRLPHTPPAVHACVADARRLQKKLEKEQIDAVVTSPPYLTAQDYYRSSKLELAVCGWWQDGLGSRLGPKIIGSGRGCPKPSGKALAWVPRALKQLGEKDERARRVVDAYLSDMGKVLGNLERYLRPSGKCCLVIGNSTIQGVWLPVHSWIGDIAETKGFKLIGHDVDVILERRVPPQREGHNSVIDKEHLLILQKAGSGKPGGAILTTGHQRANQPGVVNQRV